MIHHYITQYMENGKLYAESWIQIDFFSRAYCFSRRKIQTLDLPPPGGTTNSPKKFCRYAIGSRLGCRAQEIYRILTFIKLLLILKILRISSAGSAPFCLSTYRQLSRSASTVTNSYHVNRKIKVDG